MNNVGLKSVLWGYLASGLNITSGLLLLPAVVYYLTTEEVSLWIVFVTLTGIAQLIEFGFQPTIARNVAYIYTGAQSLLSVGLPDSIKNENELNLDLLSALIESSKRIYSYICALTFLILITFGLLYVCSLIENTNRSVAIVSWVIMVFGTVFNSYYGYINGILQGRGDIVQANKLIVISRCILIGIGLLSLSLGLGLIGLSVATLLSVVVSRMVGSYFLTNEKYFTAALTNLRNKQSSGIAHIKKLLWHNASRLGLVQLSTFLMQRGNILIASSVLGLADSASYSLTVTMCLCLYSLSLVYCQLMLPRILKLQAMKCKEEIKKLYIKVVVNSWITYILGFLLLFICGSEIMDMINAKTKLLPTTELVLLGFVFLLELNHSIAATYLTTINHVPFVPASLLSAIANIILSLLLIHSFGVLGIIFSQGITQFLYNNWKWPYEAIKHLNIK